MVFLYRKDYRQKKGKKIRNGYSCMGCDKKLRTKKALSLHQGSLWPGCVQSYPGDIALLKAAPIAPLL